MNAPRLIPPDVRARQTAASDPAASVWVAANAGSGKTHVLAQRVIRLLLRGVPPSRILCITFTKAAATNMAMRVFDVLSTWIAYDDETLDAAIRALGEEVDVVLRARARRLFATALETPGGLKVQTIHAFCTRLLHQFPFEANVAAKFTVLDDASERQLLDQLSLGVLLEAAAHPQSEAGQALTLAIESAADQTFRQVIAEAIRKRDDVEGWIRRTGSVQAAVAELSLALGLSTSDTRSSVEEEVFLKSAIPASEWPILMAALAQSSSSDQKQMERLQETQSSQGDPRLRAYLSLFCSTDLAPRKNIVTKAFAVKHPSLFERLMQERERVCALVEKRKAVACRDRTAALLVIAHAVLSRYRAEKERRGLLDYDDLIDKTLVLFERSAPSWVLYKLDLGIDHILVDEAQDTSAKQWQIIETIVSEFTAGAGARAKERTLFAVGDDKQSIFSFQGAAPLKFDAMRKQFHGDFSAAGLLWRTVSLQTSFRSGEIVLHAVDTVFSRPQAYEGLAADPTRTVHQALQDAAPSAVEIWDLLKADPKTEIEGWDAPFDAVAETSPQVRLAYKIARHIRQHIGRQAVGRDGRPARAGDFLILVRQRGALFEAVIRALKHEDIAVAGADRLVLTEHIAIMDLMALADALLLPEDDLALATVLKSPLLGLTEEDLFALAWNRGKRSLRDVLRLKASDDLRFAAAHKRLEQLTEAAHRQSPFTFYARLLGAYQGRKHILARLGGEAADAIDEFLNLALVFESREPASLQAFIAWVRAACAEVRRDMEISRDEVRVMTVHGAKGLEAPIVILADTTTPPAGPPQNHPKIYPATSNGSGRTGAPYLLWAERKANDVPVLAQARETALLASSQEYRRLLYVAMTRAAEQLIVCGAEGLRARPEGCWYDLVFDALQPHCTEEQSGKGESKTWRYRNSSAQRCTQHAFEPQAKAEPELPAWLLAPPRADTTKHVAVRPSDTGDERDFFAAGAQEQSKALLRGRLTHRLMQSLPDIPAQARERAAASYLARAGAALGNDERQDIAAKVFALLSDARFVHLFAEGRRAEVPIVGRIIVDGQAPWDVSGQVDRMAVTPTTVLIADYKTNRPPPARLDDVPPGYLRQLALYRTVLRRIYPKHDVRAALIFTEVPDLMEIPDAALDAALPHVTSA